MKTGVRGSTGSARGHRPHWIYCAGGTPPMILLMLSTILACVALGVAIAYGFCSGVFAMAKMHVRSQTAAPLQIQTKSANP
jgi:hypothetical protein